MTDQALHGLTSATELRSEFDNSFAAPVRDLDDAGERFLAVRSAGQALALRIADLTRLERQSTVTPLPGERRELLGVAGVQGRLVPVFCLASLLGYERSVADWRWLAVAGQSDPVGLALDSLDAFFSLPTSGILDLGGDQSTQGYVRFAVRFEGELRRVVEVRSIQATLLRALATPKDAIKESL